MFVRWLVLFLWVLVGSMAQQLATRQLILDFEGGVAYLNGSPITLNPRPGCRMVAHFCRCGKWRGC